MANSYQQARLLLCGFWDGALSSYLYSRHSPEASLKSLLYGPNMLRMYSQQITVLDWTVWFFWQPRVVWPLELILFSESIISHRSVVKSCVTPTSQAFFWTCLHCGQQETSWLYQPVFDLHGNFSLKQQSQIVTKFEFQICSHLVDIINSKLKIHISTLSQGVHLSIQLLTTESDSEELERTGSYGKGTSGSQNHQKGSGLPAPVPLWWTFRCAGFSASALVTPVSLWQKTWQGQH